MEGSRIGGPAEVELDIGFADDDFSSEIIVNQRKQGTKLLLLLLFFPKSVHTIDSYAIFPQRGLP